MSVKKTVPEETLEDQTTSENQAAAAAAPAPSAAASHAPASKNGKSGQPFDPTQYLSKFDGRDYLEVKWRLLWLRSEHPEARITTEIVQHNEEGGFALFRAEAEVPGGGKATGWGSETVRDFHDYIEAAETKALGRALAALGYGTQFCQDYDFSANARPGTLQVVDAPVNQGGTGNVVERASNFIRNGHGNGAPKGSFANSGFRNAPQAGNGGRIAAEEDDFDRIPSAFSDNQLPGGSTATEKQLKAIYAIGRASKRLSESQVDDRCIEVFGVRPGELTKAEASQFIDMLKGEVAA